MVISTTTKTEKKLDLGFMKIPFEGPFPFHWFCLTFVWGIGCGILILKMFGTGEKKHYGPAIEYLTSTSHEEFVTKCQSTILATIGWCMLYYNLLGLQTNTNAILAFEIVPPSALSTNFHYVNARIVGNTLEQGSVFLISLWLYTLFVDSFTVGPLASLYLLTRFILYPLCYIIPGELTVWIEIATQPQYAVIGMLWYGLLVGSSNWIQYIQSSPIQAGLSAWCIGFFPLFPGLPFSNMFTFLHYQCEKNRQSTKKKGDKKQP